jgi:hypothetical protein
MTTTTTAPAKGKAAAAPVANRPFFPGTLDLETQTYTQVGTLTTAAQTLPTYYPKTNGFLCDLWIEFATNATPNTNADVAYNEDMPLGALSTVCFSDTGGQPIIGPFSSWDLAVFVKWGGFSFSDDPRNSTTYTATGSTTSAGGCFRWILRLPIQFVRREPLGALPNTNSNNTYALDLTVSTLALIYATAPNAAPTFTVRVYQDSYRQSSGKDAQRNPTVTTPPGLGAVSYCRRTTTLLGAGTVDVELPNQEGSYRTLLGIFRATADGLRATGETNWPNPSYLYFNNDVPYERTITMFRRKMEVDYGYIAALAAVNGKENGLYAWQWINDHGLKAGSEDRYRYLQLSAADTLGFRGVTGGAGTLTLLHNFIRPPGGNIKNLSAR